MLGWDAWWELGGSGCLGGMLGWVKIRMLGWDAWVGVGWVRMLGWVFFSVVLDLSGATEASDRQV